MFNFRSWQSFASCTPSPLSCDEWTGFLSCRMQCSAAEKSRSVGGGPMGLPLYVPMSSSSVTSILTEHSHVHHAPLGDTVLSTPSGHVEAKRPFRTLSL